MIKLNYKPLSVNEVWQGKRYKTEDYHQYEKDILLLLPNNIYIPEKGNLQLFIEWGFSNRNSDNTNPLKPFEDILCKKYSINDNRFYHTVLNKKIVPKGKEYMSFMILSYAE